MMVCDVVLVQGRAFRGKERKQESRLLLVGVLFVMKRYGRHGRETRRCTISQDDGEREAVEQRTARSTDTQDTSKRFPISHHDVGKIHLQTQCTYRCRQYAPFRLHRPTETLGHSITGLFQTPHRFSVETRPVNKASLHLLLGCR
jgi:hypothetical protein